MRKWKKESEVSEVWYFEHEHEHENENEHDHAYIYMSIKYTCI